MWILREPLRAVALVWLLVLPQVGAQAQTPQDPFPKIAAAYWLEIDGQPTWERHADQRLAPASLTKLMTTLLVLEAAKPETLVTVTAAATRETGTRLKLKSGEQLAVQDLLAATLIASANDACHALADHVASSENAFVQRMNQRATALGMRNTHFANGCGHDAPGHFSSARDLALLAHAVMQFPLALQLAAQKQAQITSVSGSHYALQSTNALIGRYDGAIGLKTGHTERAGNCLVALARRGNTQVLLVLLKGSDRWWDAVDLLDLAFDRAKQSR